jgi:outer membrane protein OmpA-like peptidoglycan-associated protein
MEILAMRWTDGMRRPALLALLVAATALAACNRPAGEGALAERFGDASAVNQARQIAYRTPEDFRTDLGRVFAAETEETVTFAFNSAALDSTARRALRGQAAWLKENPEVRMTITGHTDLVGPESYNQGLGLRRARAVVNYLAARGVSRERLDAVESRGESQPLVATEARERRNRRAVTTVAGFRRNYVGDGLDGVVAQRLYREYQTGGVDIEEVASAQ